jgi:hypothetical protein
MDCKRRRDGRVDVDFIVGHEANQHGRHRHVQRPANKQGEADAQRKVALGLLHLAESKTTAISETKHKNQDTKLKFQGEAET